MQNDQYEVAGIPLDDVDLQIKSLIDDIKENDIITILNPLTIPFRGKFSRSVPDNSPLNSQDKRMAELGAPVTKLNGGIAHTTQFVEIPAGGSLKLHGYAAKVVARQLVTEIIQRKGGRNKIADPKTRRDQEEIVILNAKAIEAKSAEDPTESFERELRELNDPLNNLLTEVQADERSFPTESPTNVAPQPKEVHPEAPSVSRESGSGHSTIGERTIPTEKPGVRIKAKA